MIGCIANHVVCTRLALVLFSKVLVEFTNGLVALKRCCWILQIFVLALGALAIFGHFWIWRTLLLDTFSISLTDVSNLIIFTFCTESVRLHELICFANWIHTSRLYIIFIFFSSFILRALITVSILSDIFVVHLTNLLYTLRPVSFILLLERRTFCAFLWLLIEISWSITLQHASVWYEVSFVFTF